MKHETSEGGRRKFKIVGPRSRGDFVGPAKYRRSLFFLDFVLWKLQRTGNLKGGKIVVLYTPDKFVKKKGGKLRGEKFGHFF